MALEDLKPRVQFQAGVVFEIKKNTANQNGQLSVVLSGPALQPILDLANMTELAFNTDQMDLNKLARVCQIASSLFQVTEV